jgi:hypothetical protein
MKESLFQEKKSKQEKNSRREIKYHVVLCIYEYNKSIDRQSKYICLTSVLQNKNKNFNTLTKLLYHFTKPIFFFFLLLNENKINPTKKCLTKKHVPTCLYNNNKRFSTYFFARHFFMRHRKLIKT